MTPFKIKNKNRKTQSSPLSSIWRATQYHGCVVDAIDIRPYMVDKATYRGFVIKVVVLTGKLLQVQNILAPQDQLNRFYYTVLQRKLFFVGACDF